MLMTRHLLKNLFSVTAFVALSLAMVIWLTQSLKLLDLIANSDAPAGLFIKLIALTLPRFLEIILPLALVAGILFIYNKMIMENELIVLRSCGFDQLALAKPALILAGAITILILCMSTYISPKGYAATQILKQDVKSQYSTFLLREGVFNTFSDNLTVYLRARAKNGDLLGVTIHDTRDKSKPPVTITAKRGRIVMETETPNIIVYDGMRQQMDNQSEVITKLFFSRYTIEVKGLETSPTERWREANERTLWELLHPDMSNRRDRSNRDIFRAETHHRLVTPFNAIGYALVALATILLGPFNRRGQNKKILAGAIIIVCLQAIDLIVVNRARSNLAFVPALYAVTFTPIVICLFLLHARGEEWLVGYLRKLRQKRFARAEAKRA